MTESRGDMQGLKAHAEATLFSDLRVTPELKERLHHRIRVAEKQQRQGKERRPMSPWTWGSVAAAAAVLVIVGVGQQVAPLQSRGMEKAEVAQSSAPAVEGAAVGHVTSAPATPPAIKEQLKDQVTFTATNGVITTTLTAKVLDANGNSVGEHDSATLTSGPNIPGTEAQPGRKIILNAEYSLQVKDAAAAMQNLQNVAAQAGGYVVDAVLNKNGDDSWAGRLTLRIPAKGYTGAVDQVRQLGDVKSERQWSQDVTDQYMDLESRIRIQQEFETKLTELAAKAEKFEDWLKLTQQINDTRANIERMQGQIKLLANQVDYSTINVSIVQPAPGRAPEPKPDAERGLWSQMVWAFGDSIRVMLNVGKDFLVGLAATSPFLVIAAVAAIAVAVGLRARSRRRHHESQ